MNKKKNSYPWPVRAVDWIFWRVVDAAVTVTKGPSHLWKPQTPEEAERLRREMEEYDKSGRTD